MADTTAPVANPLKALAQKAAAQAAQSRTITLRSDTTQFDALNGKLLAEFILNRNASSLSKANSVFTDKQNNVTRTPVLVVTTPHGKVIVHMSKAIKEELASGELTFEGLLSCTFRKTWNLWEENAEGTLVPRAEATEVLMLTKPGNGRVMEDEEEMLPAAE